MQTLFYGVFSGWATHAREKGGLFDWRTAVWTLQVPAVRALFEQVATPGRLGTLGVVDVLGWAADALNRVDTGTFFARFEEANAVQHFYEPFLAAFDPDLRRALGVWYTPPEIVQYMVERVDRVLRDELGIADGLADSNVWVLDPCTGTGSYLVEVLRRIRRTLEEKGVGATLGPELKEAATRRIAGFEVLPAPFVIAHWQAATLLSGAGAPLNDAAGERAAILDDWPRMPLPSSAEQLILSAQLGRRVADLLDPDTPVPGVTTGAITATLRQIAVLQKAGGGSASDAELAVTARWGSRDRRGAVMPGPGQTVERDYTDEESDCHAAAAILGGRTNDVYLNGTVYWRNIPGEVWDFAIGGFQVFKKWLSYREESVLGRPLTLAEINYFRDATRRLAALSLLGPELDHNYRACAEGSYPWRTIALA